LVPLLFLLHMVYLVYADAHEVFGIANDECAEFIALAMVAATGGLFLPGMAAGYFCWI